MIAPLIFIVESVPYGTRLLKALPTLDRLYSSYSLGLDRSRGDAALRRANRILVSFFRLSEAEQRAAGAAFVQSLGTPKHYSRAMPDGLASELTKLDLVRIACGKQPAFVWLMHGFLEPSRGGRLSVGWMARFVGVQQYRYVGEYKDLERDALTYAKAAYFTKKGSWRSPVNRDAVLLTHRSRRAGGPNRG